MFSRESGTKTDATVSNTYEIQKIGICCRENTEAVLVGLLEKKAYNLKKGSVKKGSSIAKFLRTPI